MTLMLRPSIKLIILIADSAVVVVGLVCVLLTAVIAPPRGPLEAFFYEGLRPLLEPPAPKRGGRRSGGQA